MISLCRRLAWGIAAVAILVAPAVEAQPIQELASAPLGLPTFPGAILAYKDKVFVGAGQSLSNQATIVQFDSDLNPVGTPITFSDPGAWRGIWGAALETETGMGYFVSWTFSSNTKVDLETFTLVNVLTLSIPGGLLANVHDGILYIGCDNNPVQFVRVDLGTFTQIGSALTADGLFDLGYSAVVYEGFIYYLVQQGAPDQVVKLDPVNWAVVGTTPISTTDTFSITAYDGKLFAVDGFSGGVAMVDVATFTELPDSPLPYAGTCSAWQIVQFDGFGYVSCGDYPLQIAVLDLKYLEWLTPPNLELGSDATISTMFLAPSSNPTVGYVGGFVNFGAQAPVFKFSADLRHCIYTGITLAGKASKSSVRVVQSANKKGGNARGAVVMYTVTMANSNGLQKRNKADPAEPKPKRHVNKTAIAEATAFTPAGLVVTLPAGTSFVRARVSPAPTVRGAKRNQTLAEPVYDAEANTVTWLDVPLAMRKKRKYVVTAWVLPTATSPLVFQAAAPNCRDLPMTQSYVAVTIK